MRLNRLLFKKPVISEKATDLSKSGKYVFLVDARVNKNQVKQLIKEVYGVNVTQVNLLKQKTKKHNYKKAMVTLKQGESIEIIPK